MSEKRMKKNISFSEHEKDIYKYINEQKNASGLIKKLIRTHMLMEKGLVVPVQVDAPAVTQGTNTDEEPEVEVVEPEVEVEVEVVEPVFSPEDEENRKLMEELDI